MCNFRARAEWRSDRRSVSFYLDVETKKYQYCLINPNPLDCIIGKIIVEDAISDRYLNNLPHIKMNLIGGSISGYCSILDSSKWIDIIKQENELVDVLGDIYSCLLGGNW